MTHEIKIQPVYYEKIKAREKIYEVRLFDEKRKLYKIGDTLVIKKKPLLKEFITCTIVDIIHFNSFYKMAQCLPPTQVGFGNNSTPKDIEDVYHCFYTKDKEQQLGVIAIKLKLN